MTILADYMLDGGGTQVRKIQGVVTLNGGTATETLPAEFANVPQGWPVMCTRLNAGTAEGELTAGFDSAGPEITFVSTEVTDDANVNYTMEIPVSLLS